MKSGVEVNHKALGLESSARPTTGRLDSARRQRRWTFPAVAAVCLIVAAHVVWPVLRTPFGGDDIQGSQIRAHTQTTDESPAELVNRIHDNWVRAEGRFFPVALVEYVALFSAVRDRGAYKSMELAAPLVVMALVGILVGLLAGNRWAGLASMATLIPLHQFRGWYDPLTQFSLLQPSVASKILGSAILLVLAARSSGHRRRTVFLAIAAVLWVLALLQYETTYPLLVIPLAILFHERSAPKRWRWVAVAALGIPTVLLSLFIVYLRVEAPATKAPGYTISLDPGQVVPAFGRQATGAFPLSYPLLARGDVPNVSAALDDAPVPSVAAGLAAAAVLLASLWRAAPMARATAKTLVVIGVALFAIPAGVIATSLRWQQELDWGLPYLPVYQQALGLAILLPGIAGMLRRPRTDATGGARRVAWITTLAVSGIVLGVAVPVTRDVNDWIADGGRGARVARETFDRAGPAGFFDVLTGGSVVSPAAVGVMWFNTEYVEWVGGPSKLPFNDSIPSAVKRCGTVLCDSADRELWYVGEWSNGQDLYVLWLAPIVARGSGGGKGPVVDLGRAQAFPGLLASRTPDNLRVDLHASSPTGDGVTTLTGRPNTAGVSFPSGEGLPTSPLGVSFTRRLGPRPGRG